MFRVPFQHLPAETEGTKKRPQYLNSGTPSHKGLPDVEMFQFVA